ncbi:aldehyde dehydrogenase domain-containing protein [Dactylonectria estremocensis]|uniref:Aldehyde dehydrogenase domain-containing protein n=1 Tax=Dactylonectria estremocensis TaxID=1079267 RepID=A0A9P9EHZ1_9HYPO|nr:aldehyde dehydrogenase domain-containing protein [Dactylonectria estremocensis]
MTSTNAATAPRNGEQLETGTGSFLFLKTQDVHLAQGASIETAREATQSSYRAFLRWKATAYTERRDLLLKVADVIQSREEALVAMQMLETSCQEEWARFNVALAAANVREIASNISQECTGELPSPQGPGAFCMVFKDPIGPVLAIAPWNASMIISTRALAAPLGAGCTIVFKASELCPGVHRSIVRAFEDAGLPGGCINTIQARREDSPGVTEALIAHPAISKIAFTGSTVVGSIIGQLASKYLKPVLLELGGKAPAIILKDADIERAASLCAKGAFLHHGQICMSTDRIIVVKDVAEDFSRALADCVKKHHPDGAGSAITIGVAQRARSLVDAAVKNGASYLVGNNEFRDDTNAAIAPTVITGVKPEDQIFSEETFGPSAVLYIVEDENEAVVLANSSKYGLNAAVHSRDMFSALRVARRIECGQVHIGTVTEYDEANAPIGGTKASGWGRNNGKYALREFLVTKTISVHDPLASVNFGAY